LRSDCDLNTPEGRARFVSMAKPHIEKMVAPGLKVQLINQIGSLAELSPEDAQRSLDPVHRPVYRRAPVVKREPPSSYEWKLLSRVAAYPSLSAEINIDLVTPSLEEAQALRELCAYLAAIDHASKASHALVIEHFQNSAHADVVFEAQGYALDLKESEDESRGFVRYTLRSLEIERKRETLKNYEKRLEKGQLSKDEHLRYGKMISEVRALEQHLVEDARRASK